MVGVGEAGRWGEGKTEPKRNRTPKARKKKSVLCKRESIKTSSNEKGKCGRGRRKSGALGERKKKTSGGHNTGKPTIFCLERGIEKI